ncbi:hypothetical protein Zm00014a_008817 [Zea mays]|uniref:Uncharacterized protein n=1 Tax=Zea mays TaxID=4577 RepID=A0A3L6EM20_MAIZE|nr:hypothetical protein Zm00014a_008817 [Zea mays]
MLTSLRLFFSLSSFNSRPSTCSFNALLHSLGSVCRLCLAAPTKLYITPNLSSCNILLMFLVCVGDPDSALKADTSMIVQSKKMKRREFDIIIQASTLITYWFSGSPSECDIFYDAQNDFLTPEWDSENLQVVLMILSMFESSR